MNETAYRSAAVYIQDHPAGLIRETESGCEFAYSREYLRQDYAVPASITLPLSGEPYQSPVLFPFFDGLSRKDSFWTQFHKKH